ncbi:MAG: energy transducer TonB [Mariprofundales bacterium]|nr:energy transducer TonB [Mariprofundales bacterium]
MAAMMKSLLHSCWLRLARGKQPLVVALVLSVCLHLLAMVLITVDHHSAPKAKAKPAVMDVVLFKQPKKPKPKQKNDQAQVIANRTLKGTPPQHKDQRTRMARAPRPRLASRPHHPVPPTPPPARPQVQKAPSLSLKRHDRRAKLHQVKPRKRAPKHARPKAMPTRPIPLSRLLSPAMPFAQESRHRMRARQRPSLLREANIPINTREVKYAPYAHALVNALEEQWRPSQANYADHPDQDRQVLMRVSIDRDGSLSGVEILRPSPIAGLNTSAVQAIHDAAPFRPLPSSWGLDRASFYLTFEVVDNGFVFHGM